MRLRESTHFGEEAGNLKRAKRLLRLPGVQLCVDLTQIYLELRVSRASAQLAYYMLMSVFPLLIVVSAIIGMMPSGSFSLLNQVLDAVPNDVRPLLEDYLHYIDGNQGIALLSGGIIMTITATSAAFRGLMDIFNEAFGQRTRSGVVSVLLSVLFSVVLLLLAYGSLLVVLLGDWLLGMIRFLLDVPVLHYGWRLAQVLMPFALLLAALLLLYRFTAHTPHHKRSVLPGALLATVALVASTQLFSTFIGISNRYVTVYGSLASVIILMVWLFLCSNIIIMGNIFNFVRTYDRHRFDRVRAHRSDGEKGKPGGD